MRRHIVVVGYIYRYFPNNNRHFKMNSIIYMLIVIIYIAIFMLLTTYSATVLEGMSHLPEVGPEEA